MASSIPDTTNPPLEVYSHLVVQTQSGVRAYIRSLGVPPEAVDDVAQDAFLLAYRHWAEYDVSRDFGAWVRGITFRLVLNNRRKTARRVELMAADELTTVLVQTAPDPQQCSPGDPDLWEAIHQCMGKLPEEKRQLLAARYEEDLSLCELAQQAGLSVEGVRKSLQRLRLQLRACVELQLKESWS
jgi:RNA polymerase sigma-70 factor, ECF subfamily